MAPDKAAGSRYRPCVAVRDPRGQSWAEQTTRRSRALGPRGRLWILLQVRKEATEGLMLGEEGPRLGQQEVSPWPEAACSFMNKRKPGRPLPPLPAQPGGSEGNGRKPALQSPASAAKSQQRLQAF